MLNFITIYILKKKNSYYYTKFEPMWKFKKLSHAQNQKNE